MIEYGFEYGKDFTSILGKSSGGRPSMDYSLTIDMAKEISMIQRTDRGKQARSYFIECEKQLKQIQPPQLPQTKKEWIPVVFRSRKTY